MYLVAALLLTLGGEGLIRGGLTGVVQAGGAALIVTGVAALLAGFINPSAMPTLGGRVSMLLPLVYLAAFPVAIGAIWARKLPSRAIGRTVAAGIAIPALWWCFALFGPYLLFRWNSLFGLLYRRFRGRS